MNRFNGILTRRRGRTIFIPLPRDQWTPCGTCVCEHCNGAEAFWDTLAVSTSPKDKLTWTVHAPELHGAKVLGDRDPRDWLRERKHAATSQALTAQHGMVLAEEAYKAALAHSIDADHAYEEGPEACAGCDAIGVPLRESPSYDAGEFGPSPLICDACFNRD